MTTSAEHYSGSALKRSALHFLTGKAASALLNFAILLWLVRLLPVNEYGVYVTLVAGMELTFGIAGLGISWMAARYLPDYRIHADGLKLTRIASRLLAWQFTSLLSFTFLLYLSMGYLLPKLELSAYQQAATLYLLVLLIEGPGKQSRENMLGPLLQQGSAQASQIARNLAFLVFLAFMVIFSRTSLTGVIQSEIAAATVGSTIGLAGLVRYLYLHRAAEGKADWHEPTTSEMWLTSIKMYLSELFSMLYSPQVFIMLVQRKLGLEATALFGFLRSLYEQIARYLPATLLFSLVRPKLVASYVRNGSMKDLSDNANLGGKLSLFVLMPLIAISAVGGEEIIHLASGARFDHAGMYFLGFMLALIPFSQRQILESVAVASSQSLLCTKAAISGILILPFMYLLILSGFGLWSAIISLGVGHLFFNGIIYLGMSRRSQYRSDFKGLQKLIFCALAGYLAALPATAIKPLLPRITSEAVIVITGFLFMAYFIKPFNVQERSKINGLLNRQVFVW